MILKCTQSSRAQFFCGTSFGKKPINNKLFDEMGKVYMQSLAFTSDKHFQWEKKLFVLLLNASS